MYNHQEVEKKWQERWEKAEAFKVKETAGIPKEQRLYVLDMFPYPSGQGLHVGHPEGYTATDIYSRYQRARGLTVLHPMGWDAFGLPAENYAIKTGTHPAETTAKNIATFKRQIQSLGFSYDWSREVDTTDPEYYRWTQWIFLQLFKKGLAYESQAPINFCPSCKTGLANEEVKDGHCERCGAEVVKKSIRQWILKITEYADRLEKDLDLLDWPESIKILQRNWIGRSEGVQFALPLTVSGKELSVYTTRIDTVFGMTFCVIAPEHSLLKELQEQISNWAEVQAYLEQSAKKSDLERTELAKEKTGVEVKGFKAINPFTKQEIPVYVGDFVLGHYGTGAVMAVPAHDTRDFEFAKKHKISIKKSIDSDKTYIVVIKESLQDEFFKEVPKFATTVEGDLVHIFTEEVDRVFDLAEKYFIGGPWYIHSEGLIKKILFHSKENKRFDWGKENGFKEAYDYGKNIGIKDEQLGWREAYEATTDDGILINSEQFSGLTSEVAREKMADWLEQEGIGQRQVNYKLRDWIFSRQRYWGEPIPLVYCEHCAKQVKSKKLKVESVGEQLNPGWFAVPENELPITLPVVEKYEPSGTGESPLVNVPEWVNTKCPRCGGQAKRETNTMPQWAGSCWYYLRYLDPQNKEAFVGEDKEKYWMPVDLYVGGAEHAVLHLLYARFWHKVLFDLGCVSSLEPFMKLKNQGMILGENGEKMSKSRGNVVNPDEVIKEYGADTLRLYEMFMGPFEDAKPWNTKGLVGVRRFLDKVYNLAEKVKSTAALDSELNKLLHQTIKKVGEDIEAFRFNTAISQLMIFVNAGQEKIELNQEIWEKFLQVLAPFAPHLAEELWSKLGHQDLLAQVNWPQFDPQLIVEKELEIVVQVNGKVRAKVIVPADISEAELRQLISKEATVQKWLAGQEFKKFIYIKGRLVNIVV